jgi:hypothetical protein
MVVRGGGWEGGRIRGRGDGVGGGEDGGGGGDIRKQCPGRAWYTRVKELPGITNRDVRRSSREVGSRPFRQ